jgi:hypothetical protein
MTRLGPGGFLTTQKGSGADMTNETMKVLLMFLIIGGIQAAIRIPEMLASQYWALLSGAMADIRATFILPDPAPQLALVKRKSYQRQLLR